MNYDILSFYFKGYSQKRNLIPRKLHADLNRHLTYPALTQYLIERYNNFETSSSFCALSKW